MPLLLIMVTASIIKKQLTMKKLIILFFAFTGTVLSANAQLKVDSLGKVTVSKGLSSSLYAANAQNISLYGSVGSASSSGCYYGLATSIFGLASNGSAVYGSSVPVIANITGKYAGYFYGNTYVSGTLTANSLVTPSDLSLKENISALSDRTSDYTTLHNLMNMNVVQYNYKKKEVNSDNIHVTDESLATGFTKEEIIEKIDAIEKEKAKRLHFGLIAQELQTIYPNLVEENEEGYLSVNYVELVPILIRSIQELKQEVDELRGIEETARKAKQSTPTAVTSEISTNTSTLYQNTPNPFKEQTIIRYRLANDAKNAAICIFDMQGKLLKKYPVSSGTDSITISGYELGEGMFLYTLMVNGQEIDTKRMILTK